MLLSKESDLNKLIKDGNILIKIKRLNATNQSTTGLFFIDGKFECFTLEDPYQCQKIKGNTRIPCGIYKLSLRTEGKLNEKYIHKIGDGHKGMLWLNNVPNFSYIYIHIGNTVSDTSGCILVGDELITNVERDGKVLNSTRAYKRIYKKIVESIYKETTYLQVFDEKYDKTN